MRVVVRTNMLTILGFLAASAILFHAQPVDAQVSCQETWPDASSLTWQGDWEEPGWHFTFSMTLTRSGHYVTGVINWTLVSAPVGAANPQVGHMGQEYVSGIINTESCSFVMAGLAVSDPTFLGMEHYSVQLDTAGGITGRSRASSRAWDGTLSGRLAP